MRRLARWLLATACALSLLVSAALTALAARSACRFDSADVYAYLAGYLHAAHVESWHGTVAVRWYTGPSGEGGTDDPHWQAGWQDVRALPQPPVVPPYAWDRWKVEEVKFCRWGFTLGVGNAGSGADIPFDKLTVPDWSLILLFAIPPLLAIHGRRTARRRARGARGLCVACGYDLRATPGRCPECGTLAAPRRPPKPTRPRKPAAGPAARRALAHAVAAVSLLLCLATLATWRASRGRPTARQPTLVPVASQLARTLPQVHFDNNALGDVLDFFRDVTGVKLLVDWPALTAAGVGADATVKYDWADEPVGDALAYVLRRVDPRLLLVERRGVLYVTTTTTTAHDADPDVERRVPDPFGLRPPRPSFPDWELPLGHHHNLTCHPAGNALRLTLAPADVARPYTDDPRPPGAATAIDRDPVLHLGGFTLHHARAPLNTWVLTAPFWPLALLLSVAPGLWLAAFARRLRQRRRAAAIAAHLCPTCGYDLRATPDRCPECGTIAPVAAAAVDRA